MTQPAQAAALAAALVPAPAASDTEDAGLLVWAWADPLKQLAQGAASDTYTQHLLQAADQTRPPRQNPAGRCNTMKQTLLCTHARTHSLVQLHSFHQK